MSNVKLTVSQEKFCNKYIECGNASEAYRFACPQSRKWKDEAVWVKASTLLNSDKVQVRVRQLQDELKAKSDISKERVLEEFAKIAFSSIAQLHNTWIERKDFELLTDDQKACIKSISTKILKKNIGTNEAPEIVDVEYIKIEMYDKIAALTSINKMLGYEAPQKTENTIMTDPIAISPLNNLSLEQLDAIDAIIDRES